MKPPRIPSKRKSSIFISASMRPSNEKLEGIDKDVIPAYWQNTEMYDASEIELNNQPPKLKCIDKLR